MWYHLKFDTGFHAMRVFVSIITEGFCTWVALFNYGGNVISNVCILIICVILVTIP